MKPIEFVVLATRLSADSSEACQRSALSRGYYGAYHTALELLQCCGLQFTEAAEAHEHLYRCLAESKDDALVIAARKLKSLRQARNDADYDLSDTRFSGRTFTKMQLAEARNIIDCILAAAGRLAGLRANVRNYARIVRIGLIGSD